jgi:hypothetical protein
MKMLRFVLLSSLLCFSVYAASRRLVDNCLTTQQLGPDIGGVPGDAVSISADGKVVAAGSPVQL